MTEKKSFKKITGFIFLVCPRRHSPLSFQPRQIGIIPNLSSLCQKKKKKVSLFKTENDKRGIVCRQPIDFMHIHNSLARPIDIIRKDILIQLRLPLCIAPIYS